MSTQRPCGYHRTGWNTSCVQLLLLLLLLLLCCCCRCCKHITVGTLPKACIRPSLRCIYYIHSCTTLLCIIGLHFMSRRVPFSYQAYIHQLPIHVPYIHAFNKVFKRACVCVCVLQIIRYVYRLSLIRVSWFLDCQTQSTVQRHLKTLSITKETKCRPTESYTSNHGSILNILT